MPKILFDHCYTYDHNHKFHKKLERYGFLLSEMQTEHPGQHFCRFIMFRSKNPTKRQYMEFIHIGPGGEPLHAGLSFTQGEGLEKFVKNNPHRMYKPKFTHKNYQWKKDNKSRLPGWNFVNFKNTSIKNFYTWMTEYEPSPERKIIVQPAHPNGVNSIYGLELELNEQGAKFLSYVLGRKLKEQMMLASGNELLIKKARNNRFSKLILKADNFSRFKKSYNFDKETIWSGRDGVVISNPSRAWDIVII